MSDGPHRSLPMSRSWRRVAERCDVKAFTSEEIAISLVPALQDDCRGEVGERLLEGLRRLRVAPGLFDSQIDLDLESLKRHAVQTSLEHSIVDNLHMAISSDSRLNTKDLVEATVEALCRALDERAIRSARQVEEHFYRKTDKSRAEKVRNRLEGGIKLAGSKIRQIAQQLLLSQGRSTARPSKKVGLDDGVVLQ